MSSNKRRTRADEAYEFICRYALENQGSTPTTEQIGDELGVSKQRASYLMLRLAADRKITWLTRYTYKVERSTWDPPPEVLL